MTVSVFKSLISFFLSPPAFNTLFSKSKSSWVILKSIKALETNISMKFNLDFGKNTLLLCFFFFFVIYWLILFYSRIYYTNFYSPCRTCNIHQFILIYFFNKFISCFIYVFNLNSWLMCSSFMIIDFVILFYISN